MGRVAGQCGPVAQSLVLPGGTVLSLSPCPSVLDSLPPGVFGEGSGLICVLPECPEVPQHPKQCAGHPREDSAPLCAAPSCPERVGWARVFSPAFPQL